MPMRTVSLLISMLRGIYDLCVVCRGFIGVWDASLISMGCGMPLLTTLHAIILKIITTKLSENVHSVLFSTWMDYYGSESRQGDDIGIEPRSKIWAKIGKDRQLCTLI